MQREGGTSARYGIGCRFILLLSCILLLGCVDNKRTKPLQLGDIAPDFAIKDLGGKVTVMSSLQGSPVVVRFFETTCRFCRADTPAFNRFFLAHQDKGIRVLYIGSFYEKEESLREFARKLEIAFPLAQDREGRIAALYDIRAYPQTVFIGPDQRILAALLGGVGEVELEEILGPYL